MNKLKINISRTILVLFLSLTSFTVSAKSCSLCEALENNNLKKVERIIKNKLLDQKYGDETNNGSTTYTSYNKVYDNLVAWLVKKECVTLAAWDKCQPKILPYPSYSRIGVIFKTLNEPTEIIFLIREGQSGRLRNFMHPRERLYYISVANGDGFVKHQISLCEEEIERQILEDSILAEDSIQHKQTTLQNTRPFLDTIAYQSLLGKYVNVEYTDDTITFAVSGSSPSIVQMYKGPQKNHISYGFIIVSEGYIKQIGVYSPWRIEIAGIRFLENGNLEVNYSGSYSFEENATKKYTYRKLE